jgi:ubiquinone/menaquinone biosynthesis C-methylase UbiE
MTGDAGLIAYYAARAAEYERIYKRDDPVRQAEQLQLERAMQETLRDLHVLEVACGTGFWTERLAGHAAHVTAVDAAPETLEIARSKPIPPLSVTFRIGDAYSLGFPRDFTGGMSNFWLSHIPKARISAFLRGFHACLKPGARVFMADNVFHAAVTTGRPIVKPGLEDAFADRFLEDGSRFEIVKNYFSAAELEAIFAERDSLEVHVGTCFWWVSYELKPA